MRSNERAQRLPWPHRDPRVWAAVAAGGAAGGLIRVVLEGLEPPGTVRPWTTLALNLAGVALLAYAATRFTERLAPTSYPRPFLGAGLCGGMTTFSAVQVEVLDLGRAGEPVLAAGYLTLSPVAGLLVAFAVVRLARRARWR